MIAAAAVLGSYSFAPSPYKDRFYWLDQEEQLLVIDDF